MKYIINLLNIIGLSWLLISCHKDKKEPLAPYFVPGVTLTVADSNRTMWTGVAVSKGNRIFVNFPRMDTDTIPHSVAEITGNYVAPFPDSAWNVWDTSMVPGDHFICVQSVYIDDKNFLWVLDAASPQNRGVIKGGAKLLKFDLATREVMQKIIFDDEQIVYPTSYLNDVRIDTDKNIAYITDSDKGAIIVVNLMTGKSRRLLSTHPSTKSEQLVLSVEGRIWRRKDGSLPSVHSDGIALTPQRDYLFYHALTARSLYRIGTKWLQDETLTDDQINQKVEYLGDTGPVDGMEFTPDGNLYLTSITQNTIIRLTPEGQLQVVTGSEHLKWPDSFAVGPDGFIYVTNSQLHIPARDRKEPFRLFKFKVSE